MHTLPESLCEPLKVGLLSPNSWHSGSPPMGRDLFGSLTMTLSQGSLSPSENTDVSIMIRNSSKVTVME